MSWLTAGANKIAPVPVFDPSLGFLPEPLPKDVLIHLRKLEPDEIEKTILETVKKHSVAPFSPMDQLGYSGFIGYSNGGAFGPVRIG